MSKPLPVKIPLLNTNEPDSLLAELRVELGQQVAVGDELAVVETTKASAVITAERSGFVCGLQADQGTTLSAGQVLLWLADDSDWQPPAPTEPVVAAEPPPGGLRLTDPARILAEEAGLDLDKLPKDQFITEKWLSNWLRSQQELPPIDEAAIIIYGAGGHGKAVIDLIRAIGTLNIVGLIDDGLKVGTKIMGVEVLGGSRELSNLRSGGIGQAANAVGGIGDISSRVRVDTKLQANGFRQPTLIHPTSFIEPGAELSTGVQVFPHAYIGSQAKLDHGVIVNTAAVVSHDCNLGAHVNLAPGALLAGSVDIGEQCLIGMGVTINLAVVVGSNSRLGNSSVIKAEVPEGSVVPAGAIWPLTSQGEVQA